jgi:hypothetical protein
VVWPYDWLSALYPRVIVRQRRESNNQLPLIQLPLNDCHRMQLYSDGCGLDSFCMLRPTLKLLPRNSLCKVDANPYLRVFYPAPKIFNPRILGLRVGSVSLKRPVQSPYPRPYLANPPTTFRARSEASVAPTHSKSLLSV